jgi:hypothetical protein
MIDVETTLTVSGVLAGDFDTAERLRVSNFLDSLLGFTSQVYIKSFSTDDSNKLLITFAGVVAIDESHNLLSVWHILVLSLYVIIDCTGDEGSECSVCCRCAQ